MRQHFVFNLHVAFLLAMLILGSGVARAGDFTYQFSPSDTVAQAKVKFGEIKTELQAIQFLARATFGFTYDQDLTSDLDVKKLAADIRSLGHTRALEEWIDRQAGLARTLHEPNVLQMQIDDGYSTPYVDTPSGAFNRLDYREFAWWDAALNAPDQLRQRVAFALMQIVVINDDANIFGSNAQDASGAPRYTGIVHYYDMLLNNAFGNYRTVLGDVAYHPVMGNFLTHINNQKPSADGLLLPDENFAREILQLFSMGEYRTDNSGNFIKDRSGNLIQNYTNEDIKALARVFTGMRYKNNQTNLHDPMEIVFASHHDFNEKVFPTLQFTLPARGTQDAANANAEISDAIDRIYSHPNVGPYIARILIQRLVKANPSTSYINHVANVFNDDGAGTRGNLRAVVKAILLHKEALKSQRYRRIKSGGKIVGVSVKTRGTEHCKLVEPLVRYTQFIKMFGGQPVNSSQGYRIKPSALDVSQLPYQAPSVFNYFRPDYQPRDFAGYRASRRIPNRQLHSPEAQIYTPVFANRFQNVFYRHLHNDYASNDSYNRLTFFGQIGDLETLGSNGLLAGDFTELLERLDLMMCHGSLSQANKVVINDALVNSGNSNVSQLTRLAIIGVFGTPESAIDE